MAAPRLPQTGQPRRLALQTGYAYSPAAYASANPPRGRRRPRDRGCPHALRPRRRLRRHGPRRARPRAGGWPADDIELDRPDPALRRADAEVQPGHRRRPEHLLAEEERLD